MGKEGEHSILVSNTTAEEKKGNLVEKPGWFRDKSKGDLKRKPKKSPGGEGVGKLRRGA